MRKFLYLFLIVLVFVTPIFAVYAVFGGPILSSTPGGVLCPASPGLSAAPIIVVSLPMPPVLTGTPFAIIPGSTIIYQFASPFVGRWVKGLAAPISVPCLVNTPVGPAPNPLYPIVWPIIMMGTSLR